MRPDIFARPHQEVLVHCRLVHCGLVRCRLKLVLLRILFSDLKGDVFSCVGRLKMFSSLVQRRVVVGNIGLLRCAQVAFTGYWRVWLCLFKDLPRYCMVCAKLYNWRHFLDASSHIKHLKDAFFFTLTIILIAFSYILIVNFTRKR